jgi:hypothetical protein
LVHQLVSNKQNNLIGCCKNKSFWLARFKKNAIRR